MFKTVFKNCAPGLRSITYIRIAGLEDQSLAEVKCLLVETRSSRTVTSDVRGLTWYYTEGQFFTAHALTPSGIVRS